MDKVSENEDIAVKQAQNSNINEVDE